MGTRRNSIILGVSAVAVIVISLGIVFVVQSSPKLQNTVTKLANIKTTTNTTKNTPLTNTAVSNAAAQITFVARAFTERFGTTNNQQPDGILSSVTFTTPKLEQILRTNVTAIQQQPIPKTVIVISTVARVFQITAVTVNSARVVVGATREQTIGDQTTTFQQDLTLELQLISGSWKVNSAIWRPQ